VHLGQLTACYPWQVPAPRDTRTLDERLKDYLDREDQHPIREMLGRLTRRIDDHHRRITALEDKSEKLEDDVEDTKSRDLKALRAKQKRIDDIVWSAFKVLLFTLVGAGIVETLHRLAGH